MRLFEDKFAELNVNLLTAHPPESERIMIVNSLNFNDLHIGGGIYCEGDPIPTGFSLSSAARVQQKPPVAGSWKGSSIAAHIVVRHLPGSPRK
jgi:hypothetical protein